MYVCICTYKSGRHDRSDTRLPQHIHVYVDVGADVDLFIFVYMYIYVDI